MILLELTDQQGTSNWLTGLVLFDSSFVVRYFSAAAASFGGLLNKLNLQQLFFLRAPPTPFPCPQRFDDRPAWFSTAILQQTATATIAR